MISKRKVGELQGEVVLITLQFQDFSTLLTSLSVYDDSSQHQACKLLRLLCYIRTDCHIAVIAAHHYLMSLSAVTDVERHNRRNHEALALALWIDYAAFIARYHPYLAFHIAHGTYLTTNLPCLGRKTVTQHRTGCIITGYRTVITHPDIALAVCHQIVDNI